MDSQKNFELTKKVASMSTDERYARLVELADNDRENDDDLLEFTKIMFGPEATLATE
jgi:hypothetical protein